MQQPTIETFEHKAKVLLDAYTSGTAEAMARLYEHVKHRRSWPAFRTYVQLDLGKRPQGPEDLVPITLDDARYLVARGHGFESWEALASFVAAPPGHAIAGAVRVIEPGARGEWRTRKRSRRLDEIVSDLSRGDGIGVAGEGQLTDESLAAVAAVGTITALDLSGCRGISDAGLAALKRLPSLEHLNLAGTMVSDAGLVILQELPALTYLNLAWTRVTDAGLVGLAACDKLQHLNLTGTAAGPGVVRTLEGHTALRHLEIALGDDDLPLLAGLPSFARWSGQPDAPTGCSVFGVTDPPSHLSLRGDITDRGLAFLARLDGLYSLDVDDARLPLTARGIESLTRLPQLRALRVDAKDDWMPVVASLPKLRYLGVQDTTAGDDGFEALSKSKTLEYLWGRRCHNLRRRGFLALSAMPSLRGLSVSCLNVDDNGISALPSFPALTELMPMDMPDEGFRHVSRCTRLESLILMYCRDTTDRATEHITQLPGLTYYFNSYTTISDRTPALLSRMHSLERLTFDTCHGLSNDGVAALAALPRLREVRVSGRGVSSGVADAFPRGVVVDVG